MATDTATLHSWKSIAKQEVTSGLNRQFVTASRVTIAKFEMKRGCVVPSHSHENEQVSYVVSGALKFTVGGKDVTVRAGELLQIPPHVPHGVEVLEDAHVIDVFSPIRQDWIDGTDTYFKR
ncbi:MAG TPA: cupin domain-containing protein [Vicinamibacterales bacterium]|nr:cupin domain-containing protein [Vicinamibacterales bacterium]